MAPATFEIPLDEIDGGVGPGDTVAIAAHAEVEDDARQWRRGEGTRFVARSNWAMYFTYAVQEGACGGADSCTVFVTSTTHAGNLGGLDGADAICQARAESLVSMAPPGAYKAWLSTSAASSAARLTHATVPDRLVDGTIVANNWTDLTDCDLQAPINRRKNGILGTVRGVWTGTAADGSFQGRIVPLGRVRARRRRRDGQYWSDGFPVDLRGESTAVQASQLPLYYLQQ